jgi:NitT/TauT family transport system ATP-binding protein
MEAEQVVLAVAAAKVSFAYDEKTIFRDFSLQIPEGSRVAIVGPSGCGKSTFLAMLGGHLAPTAGELVVRGRPRTVHQRDGIFPWYTVRENLAIAMGAEIHDGARSRSDRLVEEKLMQWGLLDYSPLYPAALTEGMRREVEMACALSGRSSLLLLDEPFAVLDALSRQELQRELIRTLDADRKQADVVRTVVLVTHDVFEAVALCERVIVMGGRPARIVADIAVRSSSVGDRMESVQEVYRHLGLENTPHPIFDHMA